MQALPWAARGGGRGRPGGRQEGAMSRKLSAEEKAGAVSFHVRVRPEQLEAIEAMAKEERRSRNNMTELLIDLALKELERRRTRDEGIALQHGAASDF